MGMSEQLMLAEWVTRETEQRGWSLREVARRSITPKRPHGYTVTTIAEIAKGTRTSIDYDVAFGLAQAFGVGRDEVLARAGILPDRGDVLPEVKDWSDALRRLSPDERPKVTEMIAGVLRLAGALPPQNPARTQ
jgi:transcriptional regulator with XRE-family HTH domain